MSEIKNIDGISYLETLDNDSINLVLTDPPYITSRKTGMDEHAKIVKDCDKNNTNLKTEEDWKNYKTKEEWETWMEEHSIPIDKRDVRLSLKKTI